MDANAACFDRYQCDYEGFTCTSNLTACGNEYDGLLRTHDDLIHSYNALLSDHETLANRQDELVDQYNALLTESQGLVVRFDATTARAEDLEREASEIKADLDDAQSCVSRAFTVAATQACF